VLERPTHVAGPQALRLGASVVLDFGPRARDERSVLRWLGSLRWRWLRERQSFSA